MYACKAKGWPHTPLLIILTGLGCSSVELAFLYSSGLDKGDDCSRQELPRRHMQLFNGKHLQRVYALRFFEILKNPLVSVSASPAL